MPSKMPPINKIIKVINDNDGHVGQSAFDLEISRMTLWRYSKKYPKIREAIQQNTEHCLDRAESILQDKIMAGDVKCLMFYLKTRGKGRGFVERVEQHVDNNANFAEGWSFDAEPAEDTKDKAESKKKEENE